MQRPAVLSVALLLLASCVPEDGRGPGTSVPSQASPVDDESAETNGLTLTEEGRDRASGASDPLPAIDPRDDAFERARARVEPLYPLDYRIGPLRPPQNAFDRQVWRLAFDLLNGEESDSIAVAPFDRGSLEALFASTGEGDEFRITPPASLGDAQYSLLFRRTGPEPVTGELILVLDRGRWYTAGIQWMAADARRAPYAPEDPIPRLVW